MAALPSQADTVEAITALEELQDRFEGYQARVRQQSECGQVAVDLVLATMGNALSESLGAAERAVRRDESEGGAKTGEDEVGDGEGFYAIALRKASSDIEAFEQEVAKQQMEVERARSTRNKLAEAMREANEQYVDGAKRHQPPLGPFCFIFCSMYSPRSFISARA